MNWIKITWGDNDEGRSLPNEELPMDALLICKFESSAGIHFAEMVYADSGEGLYVLQDVCSKYWNVHRRTWELDYEWDDVYFPVAYTLYPDLTNDI